MTLPQFTSVSDYGRQFTDVGLWQPHVERVCQQHGVAATPMRTGLAGTHPVFLVGNEPTYAIKFYETQFFAGALAARAERELYQLLPSMLGTPVPQLLAHGMLGADGAWPYIITSVIPGRSLGEVRSSVRPADIAALAVTLGRTLRQLHSVPINESAVLRDLRDEWPPFVARMAAQCITNQRTYKVLPEHLIAQIPRYLAAHYTVDEPVARCLIHADLNDDHVLGEFQDGHWQLTGIIDFGDAQVGDRLYELVVLHLYLFQADLKLLKTFLASYGFDAALRERFVERAMVATLLFEFNALGAVARHRPSALDAATLEELAEALWAVT